jgi:hypothetical protein
MADEPEAGAGEQSGALDGDGPEDGGEPGGENATVRAAVVTPLGPVAAAEADHR